MIAKAGKNGFLDYKSAALPAELCRHLRGKIPSDASSASRFLYAFSIRLSLTLLKAWFWIRSERTRGYSHRFGLPATMHTLRPWSGRDVVRATINVCQGTYECSRRKGLADNRRTKPRPVQVIGNVLCTLPR
jgi:hypothetical protein